METLAYYKKMKEKQTVLKGTVKIVHFDKESNDHILVLDLNGTRGIVLKKDVDDSREWKSLTGFVGREIYFVVKEVNEESNIVYCSRAIAQSIKRPEIVERLLEGEIMTGQIIHFLKYGAFVEVEGVSGLLKNKDFASDHTTISEIHNIGDKIKVKLTKSPGKNSKLDFEVVEKYKSPTIMDLDTFEREQVVLGVIKDIKPFGVFVNIAPGLDALCNIPQTDEIEEGQKVRFKILQVIKEEGKVRGKIINIL